MGKQNAIQTSWTKGEISPLARGRVDVNLYANGAETIENLIVRPQGPLFRRSGTKWVSATKYPSNEYLNTESILVPFEVSDEQAYVLEFGRGYIRFFKNKEPLFESTSDEVESFTLSDNGGLMQLNASDIATAPSGVGTDFGDLVTFDIERVSNRTVSGTDKVFVTTTVPHGLKAGAKILILGTGISTLGSSISLIDNSGGLFRITTAADHGLVTGDKVVIYGATSYPNANGYWTVTASTILQFTLDGSTFAGAGVTYGSFAREVLVDESFRRCMALSVPATNSTSSTGYIATCGLVAGGKFYVSGAFDYPQMSERFMVAKSVEAPHKWTVSNLDYDNSAGAPLGEEAWTIPIEVETRYGYGPEYTIATTTNSSGEILVTTSVVHGYSTGDVVHISGSGTGADGRWEIVVLSTTTFTLTDSDYTSGSTGGTVARELIDGEFDIRDLKFAQTADVLYITHPLYPPMKLVRTDVDGDRNDWLFAEVDFYDGPYMGLNDLSPALNEANPADGAIYPNVYLDISGYSHTATAVVANSFAITGVANDGTGEYRITIASHPFENGHTVVISGTGTTADGTWIIKDKATNTFDLTGSTFASTSSTGTCVQSFDTDDDTDFIEWKDGDQWRLGQLGTMAGGETSTTITIMDNVMSYLDETTILKQGTIPGSDVSSPIVYRSKNYGSSNAGVNYRGVKKSGYYQGNTYLGVIDPRNELANQANVWTAGALAAGEITSQYSNTFAASDVGKFIRIKDSTRSASQYWVQITKVNSTSNSNKASHSQSVVMATNNHTGKFIITNESRTATITAKKDGVAFSAFQPTDIGRSIRLGFAGRWTWGRITGYTSSSVVSVTFYADMPRDVQDASKIAGNQDAANQANGTFSNNPNTGICRDWRLGAWSDTTGYPAHIVFHEQRLAFAATTTEPQTFWMSVSADFENFMPTELDSTVLDDNAITYTLASAKANPIRWMVSGSSLGVGTSGGEWRVYAATGQNDPITPSSITAKENTTHGSLSRVAPAKTGSSIMFVDRSTWKVQELFYSYELDSMDSDELTVIGEHILREHDGAVCAAFQQKPHSIYWIVCADGTLSAMTFNKKQEVVAWHHHTIEGATVEWVTTIPSSDGTEDELWMICNRTVNGSDYRTVEVMESDFYPSSSTSRSGMKFQDSHIVIPSGAPYFTGTTITGLNWLAGKTVTITGDGVKVGTTHTVNSSGEITTLGSNTYSEIVIGPNGNADLGSLPPEGGSNFGTSQGQTKRLVSLDVRFLNTSNVSFGSSASTLTDRNLYTGSFSWFTGTERLIPRHGYDKESKYYIRQADPYPLNILFVVAKLDTNE